MTVEQTVEIPADGWFHLDLPPELAGTNGKVVVTAPLVSPEADGVDRRTRVREAVNRCAGIAGRMGFTGSTDDLPAERRRDRELEDAISVAGVSHLEFLSGILAGAGDMSLEQIREERLSKYLQSTTAR